MSLKTATRPPIRKDTESYRSPHDPARGSRGTRRERTRRLNVPLLCVSLLLVVLGSPALYFWHDYQINRLCDALVERGDELVLEEKWKEASDAYYRVWKIRQEPELLGKFTPAYDKFAVNHNHYGVIASYQRAIGALPNRLDLRNRLAELFLLGGENQKSLEQAEKALALQNPEGDERQMSLAKKWRALALLALRHDGKPIDAKEVAERLKEAHLELQDDQQLAMSLASFIRRVLDDTTDADLSYDADQVIDRFVASASDDAAAFMARHLYRTRYGLEGAENDIDQAVDLAPDDPDVLQRGAWAALGDAIKTRSDADYMTARELFLDLIDVNPTNASAYVGLGDVEYLVHGNVEQAVEIWEQGRSAVGDNLPLLLRLAEAHTNFQRHERAEKLMVLIDETIASLTDRGVDKDRNWAVASMSLFRGKIAHARGELDRAVSLLHRAVELGAELASGIQQAKSTTVTAHIELGQIYRDLGKFGLAATHFEHALKFNEHHKPALIAAAKVNAQLGRLDRSLDYVKRAQRLRNTSFRTNQLAAQLLFEQQLTADPQVRIWDQYNRVFQDARKQLAASWELRLLEIDYAFRQLDHQDQSAALGRLLRLERDFPSTVDLWRLLPFIYESLNLPDEADRAMATLEQLTASAVETKLLLADLLMMRGKQQEPRVVLKSIARGSLNPIQEWHFDLTRVRLAESLSDHQATDALLIELINKHDDDVTLLERLLHRRLSGASVASGANTRKLIQRLKKRQSLAESNWQYFEARLELAERQPDIALVKGHLASLKNRLPSWSHTLELEGRLAMRDNDGRGARIALEKAVAQPQPNPEIYALLGKHLLDSQDYLGLIRLLRKRHQTPAFMQFLRNHGCATLQNDLNFAMFDAVGLDAELWSAFRSKQSFQHLSQPNGNSIVKLMLAVDLEPTQGRNNALLSSVSRVSFQNNDARNFVEGQAMLAAREFAKAGAHFRRISAASPVRYRAELYAKEAESTRLRKTGPTTSTSQLLTDSKRRLEAIQRLRNADPNDNQEALRLLALLANSKSAEPDDRLLLAESYQTLQDFRKAEQWITLLATEDPSARNLARLVDFLLQQGRNEDAATWLQRLEKQTGWAPTSVELRTRWMLATGRRKEIPAFVETFAQVRLQDAPANLADEMQSIASIYRNAGLMKDAKRWLELLAERIPNQYEPLARLLIQNSESERAIQTCLELWRRHPTQEAATLLGRVLLYGETTVDTFQQVEADLAACLERFPNHPTVLFTIGNLRLQHGDIDHAIELLRRVTEIQPGHYLAWNNLAVALAELPERSGEALSTIDEAIERTAYDIPALLDTKAMIFIRQQNYQAAANLLQEEVIRLGSDPRYYLHLAISLDHLGDTAAAKDALDTADMLQLNSAFLSDFETLEQERLRAKYAPTL